MFNIVGMLQITDLYLFIFYPGADWLLVMGSYNYLQDQSNIYNSEGLNSPRRHPDKPLSSYREKVNSEGEIKSEVLTLHCSEWWKVGWTFSNILTKNTSRRQILTFCVKTARFTKIFLSNPLSVWLKYLIKEYWAMLAGTWTFIG